MALLTALKHHPRRPSPLPFCSPLLSVFFEKRRPKEAAKVFSWLCRPDSPCRPDPEVYRITIGGFCWLGRMAEALRAVKEMVGDGVSPGADLREAVCRGMLRGTHSVGSPGLQFRSRPNRLNSTEFTGRLGWIGLGLTRPNCHDTKILDRAPRSQPEAELRLLFLTRRRPSWEAPPFVVRSPLSGFVVMVGWQRCLRSVLRHAATMVEQNRGSSAFPYSTCSKPSPLLGQCKHLWRASDLSTRRTTPFYQFVQHSGIFSSKNLLAEEDASMVPISSPLTPVMGDGGKTEKKTVASKPLRVQAVKKDIRQSPKKVNLVAKLVRGMQVEDALLQLQVTIKRAAKTVYQVIHSARANAAHNHGLDPDRLIVDEAFVGKGIYLKRLSYHAKGRSGIMVRPKCRLTVVVREITAEEEAKIAKLRVSNFKKLTRRERQLVPHQLIETTPRWGRKRKEAATA